MSTFILKLIAIISMTIDHVGAAIGTTCKDGNLYLSGLIPLNIYNLLRCIGRIAFPIYCYLIVEGFYHTRNVKKYALRLFIFSIISQIPFSLAFLKSATDFSDLNVYFTLLFGLICVLLADEAKKHYKECKETGASAVLYTVGYPLAIILIMIVSVIIHTDYSAFGIMLILLFYFFRTDKEKPLTDKENSKKFIWLFISIALATIIFSNTVELLGLLAMLPIGFHNNKKGPSMKYVFYAYYPVHLIILYMIFIKLHG